MSRELFKRGDRLGEYEVIGKLRAGGMATLFLGRRLDVAGVSRQVVIKVIHPHLADDETIVKMFIDEARISSHIAHGNVVYVEKFGESDGVYYMVMEHVDGCSLDQVLRGLWQRRERMAPAMAVHIAMEVAAGLHAAHETCGEDDAPLHIVHRDVSPSNVLITKNGRIKVIDFGIAKARGRLGQTKSGHSLKGKIRYMSPEQAFGREIDRRTDVYALGIVLWELLACKHLFREDDELRLLELVRNPTIPPVSSINRDVTIALDEVISRATAKDVAHRIATANDLRRELMRAVPDAITVPGEDLGQLVAQTRTTLGIQSLEAELKATTPVKLLEPPAIPDSHTLILEVGGGDTSLSRSSGEQVAPERSAGKRWVMIAIVAAAVVVAGGFVIAKRGSGNDAEHPANAATSPARAPAPDPVPPDPVSVGVKPPLDAGVLAPPPSDADAAVAATPARPPVAKPRRPTAPTKDVHGVEVDGVLLADPNAGKPKPRPTTKPPRPNEVEVDGTPLAP